MTPTVSSLSEETQQQTLAEEAQHQTTSEEPPQRQTLLDLPVPRLMNTISNGKIVPLLVLAFPFTREEQFRCAEVNNINPELGRPRRETIAFSRARSLLPRHCCLEAIRSKESGVGFIMAVVVASNATPGSLARMHDIEMLQKVQRVLGTTANPRWAALAPDY
ncbi:hypothetical protein H2248_011000 [Termitomyces sp. 'cryptogamus']|nr:hypothetical protein H2248_011000 [Termitomyces sp. 'cryptogamus']